MFDFAIGIFNFNEKYTPFLIGGFAAVVFIDGVVTGAGMVLLWQTLR